MFSGTRRRLAVRERRRLRLDVPRVVVAALHPGPPEAHRARARQPAELGREVRAEHEVVEPFRAGDERVLVLVGAVDDTVARPYLVHLLVLPREPRAAEHEVQLLRCAMRVRRRRQPAGRDAHAVQADVLRAGGAAEELPRRVHLALRAMVLLDVVPMRGPHAGSLNYGFETKTLNAPRPETRCTFSVSERCPQTWKRIVPPRATSVPAL